MVPYSIDPVEASVNFGTAYGYLQAANKMGIYIAMNGIILPYDRVTKERAAGRFVARKNKL
jgi:L-asparaginase